MSGGRRSTKKSAVRTGRDSNLGESSFERAPESEAAGPTKKAGEDDDYSEDRSDLGFSEDNDDDVEPLPLKDTLKDKASVKPKIQVNDKTIFGPEGIPLSPKDLTADSPNVKEGLVRL